MAATAVGRRWRVGGGDVGVGGDGVAGEFEAWIFGESVLDM